MNDSVWSNSAVTLSAPHCLTPQYVASGPNLSISFSSDVFRLEKDEGPHFQTHALVIEAQVNTSEKEFVVGFVTDIILDFGKSAGTRIAILADVAGTNDAVEFGFDPPTTALGKFRDWNDPQRRIKGGGDAHRCT